MLLCVINRRSSDTSIITMNTKIKPIEVGELCIMRQREEIYLMEGEIVIISERRPSIFGHPIYGVRSLTPTMGKGLWVTSHENLRPVIQDEYGPVLCNWTLWSQSKPEFVSYGMCYWIPPGLCDHNTLVMTWKRNSRTDTTIHCITSIWSSILDTCLLVQWERRLAMQFQQWTILISSWMKTLVNWWSSSLTSSHKVRYSESILTGLKNLRASSHTTDLVDHNTFGLVAQLDRTTAF